MGRRMFAAAVAVLAIAGAVIAFVMSDRQPPSAASASTPASIAPLPEHQGGPPSDPAALPDLHRCIATGECQLMQTERFSSATVEIYQQLTTQPAVHVLTTYADSQPTVWSLKDEHAASYQSMTCGLANCLLNVIVGPEAIATIDMRMVSQSLTGRIEGAAVGPSLATTAVDLDADGVLDLVTTEHLIQSDGTELLFYRTYVNIDRTLTPTGCTTPSVAPTTPTNLETRTCPAH